jgi:hypothetical protein
MTSTDPFWIDYEYDRADTGTWSRYGSHLRRNAASISETLGEDSRSVRR